MLLFLVVLTVFTWQTPAQNASAVIVLRDGGPPIGVSVVALIGGRKETELGPNLKALTEKIASGTRIDVYRRVCQDEKIELLLVPAGEQLGVEDKDCYKSKEPVPGTACLCKGIGSFALGERVTIDADSGQVIQR